jgi:enoyl-CoA hydratase/carnithine racemase
MIYLVVGLGLLVGLACILVASQMLILLCRWQGKRKLISTGRAIDWEDAFERVLRGVLRP